MVPKVLWVAPKIFALPRSILSIFSGRQFKDTFKNGQWRKIYFALLWKLLRSIFSSDGTFHRIGILRFSRNGIDDDDNADENAADDDEGEHTLF